MTLLFFIYNKYINLNNTTSENTEVKHIQSIRICWLSDPERAIKRVKNSFWNGTHTANIVRRYSYEAFQILWWSYQWIRNFSSSIVLIPSWWPVEVNWLYHNWKNDLFWAEWFWYSFDHAFFLCKEAWDNFHAQNKIIWCIEIDEDAVWKTQEELWDKWFRRFEKSLGLLMSYMNHDATTHRFWLISGNDNTGWNSLFWGYLWFRKDNPRDTINGSKYNPWELAAASFHRDMFEEIDELWVPLKASVLKHSRVLLNFISQIQNEELKKYWISVIKYPLFSLINPDWEESQSLREEFPNISLKPTQWWKLIHKQEKQCSIDGKENELIPVPLREIRKIMMPYYYRQKWDVATPLARIIAKKWWYPYPKNWPDLNKMKRARDVNLPECTNEKTIKDTENYISFKQIMTLWKHDSTENLLALYDRYLFLKNHWFEVSKWSDIQVWKDLIKTTLNREIKEYKRTGRNIDTAKYISLRMIQARDRNIEIYEKDFPKFFEARISRLESILKAFIKNNWSAYFNENEIETEYMTVIDLPWGESMQWLYEEFKSISAKVNA